MAVPVARQKPHTLTHILFLGAHSQTYRHTGCNTGDI